MIRGLAVAALLILAALSGCEEEQSNSTYSFDIQGREVPTFNADSAYNFIEQQLAFGPRNPGSQGHEQAKQYLLGKLKGYASDRAVYTQNFTADGYSGEELQLSNIIAAFNLKSSDRILLSAHWDTRPRADQSSENPDKPILGADDGGSGVAVLLELARKFKEDPPPIGVDIVLFDGEDYGKEGDMDNYFLGSRYWSKNPPVKGYSPRFGILLDMVGGEGAKFPKEGYSLRYAPSLVDEIWAVASQKGYGELFINERGYAISDDHLIINRNINIPTIDIIHQDLNGLESEFPPYWHTHQDNMEIISRETLEGVGQVLTELIYNRINVEN